MNDTHVRRWQNKVAAQRHVSWRDKPSPDGLSNKVSYKTPSVLHLGIRYLDPDREPGWTLENVCTEPTLHISTLLRASSISSFRESTLADMVGLLDLVAWYHLYGHVSDKTSHAHRHRLLAYCKMLADWVPGLR